MYATNVQPSLFVPHGSPMHALRPGVAGTALKTLADTLSQPRAIIVLSAHWDTALPTVGFADRLATIHDFYGFPEALYALRYPATGCREGAQLVVSAIQSAGLPVQQDAERGLDHGAWIPLRLMFPNADVPVIPVSIQSRGGPEQAYALGQALAPLTEQNFLLVASGNITHNLRDFQQAAQQGGQTPSYVREFSDWIFDQLAAADLKALFDYRQQAPAAARAHPSEEHLLPFFAALGAGRSMLEARRIHVGIDDYVLSMDTYIF